MNFAALLKLHVDNCDWLRPYSFT